MIRIDDIVQIIEISPHDMVFPDKEKYINKRFIVGYIAQHDDGFYAIYVSPSTPNWNLDTIPLCSYFYKIKVKKVKTLTPKGWY